MPSKSSRLICYLLGPSIAILLAACGGSGDGDYGTGTLSGSITDTAADDVDHVILKVIGLRLRQQGAGGQGFIEIDLRDEEDPLEFDLLDYQDGETFPLFNDVRVPAGVYSHAVLQLEAPARTPKDCASQNPMDAGSYVVEKVGGEVPIFVPSAFHGGVQLASPFRVPLNGDAQIVIDFDLQQALLRPKSQIPDIEAPCYFVRPAFRVEAVQNTGRIVGTVESSLLDGIDDEFCSDDMPDTGNAVYVYRNAGQIPGDIDAVEPANDQGEADPMATAKVKQDPDSGVYEYVVGFLPPGDYTVAFTCQADLDFKPNPLGTTEDEQLANDTIVFQYPQNAIVEVQKKTEINFPPSPSP